MSRLPSLILTSIWLALLTSATAAPNIVFILVDDMGYADLGCYGTPDAKTPNIDRLAAEGVRFTQFYAIGTECTPSRTAFLTGRYPQRVGGLECAIGTGNVGRYDDAIALAEKNDLGLPADRATLAPGLKRAGYHTAIFGKWHLGYEPKFSPLDQGFGQFRGFLGGNVDYFHHVELSDLPVHFNGRDPVERDGYMTDLITNDAVRFIRDSGARTPFFLYLPYSTPHFPFQGPGDSGQQLLPADQWTVGSRSKYVELLESMDAGVGEVLSALENSGTAENTLVVFASDHGAMKPGLNTPFRDFKGTLFEGGIRVPCIARWPGKLPADAVSDQVGSLMDLTASFLRIGGAEVPADLDGVDILDHVQQDREDEPRTIFWRARRDESTWRAARLGDWKYVRKAEGGKDEEWLFDLAKDASEETSLVDSEPDRLESARAAVAAWEKVVEPTR